MNCPKCNSIINQGETFCKVCGYNFNQNQQPQQSNYSQVPTWNINPSQIDNNTLSTNSSNQTINQNIQQNYSSQSNEQITMANANNSSLNNSTVGNKNLQNDTIIHPNNQINIKNDIQKEQQINFDNIWNDMFNEQNNQNNNNKYTKPINNVDQTNNQHQLPSQNNTYENNTKQLTNINNNLYNNNITNQTPPIDVINNRKKTNLIPILIVALLVILAITFGPKLVKILLSKEENKVCTSTGKKVGDIVTCGEESFYIINRTSSKITMISKYTINLTSHKQNEVVDIIAFSEEKYWHNDGLKEHYGDSYPAYVYDENSNLYTHVQTYQNYLINNIGVKSAQASIISIEQLEELGCVKSNQVYKCSNAPSWVYSISYWTGEADSYRTIFSINPAGGVSTDAFNHGIRPVITISEDEVSNKNKTVQSSKGCVGTGTDVGSLITCGKEKFYVIESDDETVTMLTENRVDLKTHQQSTNAEDISFSNTNYWDNGSLKSKYGNSYPAYVYDENSNLYTHVQAYQKYLIDKIGVKSASASLISVEQLEKLGCNPDRLSCKNAPAWVYSTGYWTGTAIRSNVLRHVFSELLSTNDYSQSRGLRPIVNIKKEEIRFE